MKRTTLTSVAALVALPMIALPAHAQQSGTDTGTAQPESTAGTGTTATDGTNTGTTTTGSGATSGTSSGSDSGTSGTSGTNTGTDGASSAATGTDSSTAATGTDPSAATGNDQAAAGQSDPLIVTVGDEEITANDVRDAVSQLPPQIRQNSPDVVVPFAVEQLVLRHLILQDAASQNLAQDEEVKSLAGSDDPAAIDDATVQVYLQRQMQDVASEEAVQSAYEQIDAQTETPIPPLEDLRPQIEQQLQQQKLIEVRDRLKEDIEVVYYGPDGQPREASTGGGTGTTGNTGNGNTDANTGSTGTTDSNNTVNTGTGSMSGGDNTGTTGGSDTGNTGDTNTGGDNTDTGTTGTDTGN